MGDMADFALGIAQRQVEHYERYKDAPLHEQYDEGIIDEQGITIGNPSSVSVVNHTASGGGNCPQCGSKTVKRKGKYGTFYGCIKFPECTDSRKAK